MLDFGANSQPFVTQATSRLLEYPQHGSWFLPERRRKYSVYFVQALEVTHYQFHSILFGACGMKEVQLGPIHSRRELLKGMNKQEGRTSPLEMKKNYFLIPFFPGYLLYIHKNIY